MFAMSAKQETNDVNDGQPAAGGAAAVATKEELYEKAEAAGFSKKEVDALKDFAKIMASKIVKKYLIEYVENTARSEGLLSDSDLHGEERKKMKTRYKLYKKIIGKLNRVSATEYSGYQQLTITDANNNDHTLRYQLSIVEKDYEIQLTVPPMNEKEKVIKNMFHYMDRFIDIAIQYYNHIVSQSRLINDLAEFFGDVDVGRFQLNPNTRHLYFDEDYEKRIGILMFYVDDSGNPV